ncbi:hypothetical protein LSAT2_021417 [Lamellibrachia satsuma]|nr:hypothetical protein LSAT2_021417 [Lamellibrachia satsuma]
MTAFGRTLARKRSGGKTSCFAVVCLLIAFMVIVVRSESSMLGSYRVADDAVSPTIPMYSAYQTPLDQSVSRTPTVSFVRLIVAKDLQVFCHLRQVESRPVIHTAQSAGILLLPPASPLSQCHPLVTHLSFNLFPRLI